MITLCMDTSSKYLVLGIMQDDTLIGKVQKECWKSQSELLFPELLALLEKLELTSDDIDQIVITEGPGSYTGVRIAMTVAKVFTSLKEKPLYILGTLQLFAGLNTCRVVMDARSKRVYTCSFENGEAVSELVVEDCSSVMDALNEDENVIGDGELVGRTSVIPDLCENFALLKNHWKKVENIHTLVPEYLKPSESYLVKKK